MVIICCWTIAAQNLDVAVLPIENFLMLKIIPRNINIALNCIDLSVSWFYLYIPQFNVECEVRINVNIYDQYFTYEYHRFSSCWKRVENVQFQTCSVCAAIG